MRGCNDDYSFASKLRAGNIAPGQGKRTERGVGCAVPFLLFAVLLVVGVVVLVVMLYLLVRHWL